MSTDAAATTKAATGGIWEDSAVVDLVERAPPDWQVLRLQDVCTRITDGTHKTPRYQPAGVRFISIKNIRPFQPINWETYEKYISQDEHLALTKRCKPEFDDILFPRIGTLGFAKRIDFVEEVSIFVGLGLLKPNKALVRPKYLEYWMNHPLIVRLSRERATGSGRLTLPLEQSREFPVPVPPLTRQDEIFAEIEKQFSRLDQAVANLKRVKANLKHYKAAVLKAAFEGRLVPTEAELARREDRDYDGGGQLLEQIRSLPPAMSKRKASPAESTSAGDELPTLPPGWVWARLDAIAELTGGITVDKKRKDATAREVPYLRVANVQRGYLDLSEVKTIRASEADISSLALRTGDILFNEGGDRDKLGRGWVWEGQIGECIHQNHVFRARPLLDALSPKFISWWGNTFGKDYFLREGKQTTNLASISLTKLSRFPVPIPPASEQARITAEAARLLSIIDGLESALGVNMARASSLRTAVLSKAFRSDAKIDHDEIKSSATIEEVTMQKRALPQLPPPRASEAEDDREDLLGVLGRFSEGISVERLLVESGYKGDQVDEFYRDLAKLTKLIEVTVPENPKKTWPFVEPATVRLREKG